MSQRIGSVILFLALASCGGKAAERPGAAADSAPMAPARSAGMKLEAMAMLPVMRAHLDSLTRNPSMMRSAGSQYEAKTRRLVDAMHADMRRLGMHSDPAYEALADSVVAGSVALSTAGGAELERLVARHADQLRRLSAVYETKVATMKEVVPQDYGGSLEIQKEEAMSARRMLRLALSLSCLIPASVGAQVPTDLQSAMKTRDESLAKVDAATWDRLTTDDFTVVTADGRLLNKAERLAEFKTEKPMPRAPLQQVQIKPYGNAYVRRFRVGDIWVMDVWTKDRQGWRVAAVQVTTAKK